MLFRVGTRGQAMVTHNLRIRAVKKLVVIQKFIQQGSFIGGEIRIIARSQDRFSYLNSIVHRNSVDGSMRIIHRDFSKTFRAQPIAQGEEAQGEAGSV